MSVVFDRLNLCMSILTAWGDCSLFDLVFARVLFDLYSWTVFIGFLLLGWLAAPLTHLLFWVWLCFFEGRQSWPGGLVSLARWLGLFLLFVFCFGAIVSQCS